MESPKKKINGFTLIELIVVIAIISMLATMISVQFNKARARARDTKRLTDLIQLSTALELYYDDNGKYPEPCKHRYNKWAGISPTWGSCDIYILGFSNYITNLPKEDDTTTDYHGFAYATNEDRSAYKIIDLGALETDVLEPGDPFARCAAECPATRKLCIANPSKRSYSIYTPGKYIGMQLAECF